MDDSYVRHILNNLNSSISLLLSPVSLVGDSESRHGGVPGDVRGDE